MSLRETEKFSENSGTSRTRAHSILPCQQELHQAVRNLLAGAASRRARRPPVSGHRDEIDEAADVSVRALRATAMSASGIGEQSGPSPS